MARPTLVALFAEIIHGANSEQIRVNEFASHSFLTQVHPKHQNHQFGDLSLFLKFRLKSPNSVDFLVLEMLVYWVRKRLRLMLQTRDF